MSGAGTQYFLKKTGKEKLEFIDNTGASHVHLLRFEPIPNSLGSGTLKYYIHLGTKHLYKS